MVRTTRLTRRSLAGWLAGSAVLPGQQAAPQPQDELRAARERLREHGQQIARVKVQAETEPAFRFEA